MNTRAAVALPRWFLWASGCVLAFGSSALTGGIYAFHMGSALEAMRQKQENTDREKVKISVAIDELRAAVQQARMDQVTQADVEQAVKIGVLEAIQPLQGQLIELKVRLDSVDRK